MHPVAYSAQYEGEGRNRLTVFFRLLVAIPWLLFASLWGIAVFFAVIVAWFALVFTGRYPQSLYDFNASFLRFINRVNGFTWLMTDEWPSFAGEEEYDYPVRVLIPGPKDEYSRAKVLFRIILFIPVYILLFVMNVILEVVGIVAWFVIVFTGSFPDGLYKPMRAAAAFSVKASAYGLLLTEDFPPFWMDEPEEAPRFESGKAVPEVMPPPAPAG